MVSDYGPVSTALQEAEMAGTATRTGRDRRRTANGRPGESDEAQLRRLLDAMTAMRDGNFRRRVPSDSDGIIGELASVYNDIADRQEHLAKELARVRRAAGTQGRHDERLQAGTGEGGWAASVDAANGLIADLV